MEEVMAARFQFRITKQIKCRFGVHYEYNDLEICQLSKQEYMRVGREPDGTEQGKVYCELLKVDNPPQRLYLGDYFCIDTNGKTVD